MVAHTHHSSTQETEEGFLKARTGNVMSSGLTGRQSETLSRAERTTVGVLLRFSGSCAKYCVLLNSTVTFGHYLVSLNLIRVK